MNRKQHLLRRLDEIGVSLAASDQALALLGLGSVGLERDRLDEYSDLDFFVIAKGGCKQDLINNLDWLSSIRPLAFAFRNTVDGYKLLFDDGIFCEFAVFEAEELEHIPFAAGRVVWQIKDFNASLLNPAPRNPPPAASLEAMLGEALTNLYVGLGRYHRGEKLSAMRFVQQYAVDRVLDLAALVEVPQTIHQDIFSPERRFEQRFPELAEQLGGFMQGYAGSIASAKAILEFLDSHFEINTAIKDAILKLCSEK